jgi:hypothetical protein
MSSVALPPLPADLEYCVVARRNDSLGRRPRWQVFGALAAVSLALAAAFAAVGAWPVLPYSALEIALLGLAFYYVERRAGGGTAGHRGRPRGGRADVGGKRERREIRPTGCASKSSQIQPVATGDMRSGGASGCSAARCRSRSDWP